MFIDSHFHIDKYKNYKELYEFILRKKYYCLCVTNSPSNFISCINALPTNNHIRFAVGMHPLETNKNDLIDFYTLIDKTRYIGEIGLDYRKHCDIQIEILKNIIEMCSKKNKIFSIHCNRMEAQLYDILSKYSKEKFIIHWYTGSYQFLKKFIDLGCYFSINASMIKDSSKIEILKQIPSSRILIESDGPYSFVDNMRYSPELLEMLYSRVAQSLGIDLSIFMKQIENNFRRILE